MTKNSARLKSQCSLHIKTTIVAKSSFNGRHVRRNFKICLTKIGHSVLKLWGSSQEVPSKTFKTGLQLQPNFMLCWNNFSMFLACVILLGRYNEHNNIVPANFVLRAKMITFAKTFTSTNTAAIHADFSNAFRIQLKFYRF